MSKKLKTVGILGGFGPETSAKFMLELIDLCSKSGLSTRPSVLLSNAPVNLSLEISFRSGGAGNEHFEELLSTGARQLENAGADLLVLPCNTLHILFSQITKSSNLPVLNIINETAKFLKKKGTKSIGLLATSQTIKSQLFDRKLNNDGIKIIKPPINQQIQIDRIITNIVNGKKKSADKIFLNSVIKNLRQNGADSILLGCTDLQLIKPEKTNVPIFDTMHILAQATVEKMLKE